MKNNPQWLFIEPYVHLLMRDHTALFYNTVSKKVLEVPACDVIAPLMEQLEDPGNGYVIPLSVEQGNQPEIRSLIRQLRQQFMGDLLDTAWSKQKPVNITPLPFIQHPLKLKQEKKEDLAPLLEPRHYLQEMSFFISSGPSNISEPFRHAPYQFFYPEILSETSELMAFDLFHTVMQELNTYTPTLIHIAGTNLIHHPSFDRITRELQESPFEKKYHLHLASWDSGILLPLVSVPHTTVALYLTFPLDTEALNAWLDGFPGGMINNRMEFNVIVTSGEELNRALKIGQIPGMENLYFKPYYTGKNLDFFQQYVFVSREDIVNGKPTQTNILSRITINENDMGKFTILPGGQVYANLNDGVLGNCHHQTIRDLIEAEIIRGVSWKRVRKEVSPCRHCRYQFLCPPISSYEIFMDRYNFCDVFAKSDPV